VNALKAQQNTTGPEEQQKLAVDPAKDVFSCRCQKPECVLGKLVSFRDHMAYLCNALAECEQVGLLPAFSAPDGSAHTWHAVSYAIRMAAALEDVSANTAYVDTATSWMVCGAAADFDDAHSWVAAQYFAAAITFKFIWNAYEAAIRVAATNNFLSDKTAVRGRKLAALIYANGKDIPVLPKLTRGAERFCRLGGGLDSQLKNFTITSRGAEAAADLARILRNHIAHGCDEVPLPSDWGPKAEAAEYGQIYRMYAVSRCVLMLIQLFAIDSLSNPNEQIQQSWLEPDQERCAVDVLTNLHLREQTWKLPGV
jgi:hypothetical protein